MSQISVSELKARHELLRSDPQRYVDLMTGIIQADESDSRNYFSRHMGWLSLGRTDLALDDLDRSIDLRPHLSAFLARGAILSDLGRHREALVDFEKGEALDPEGWRGAWGPLHQATCLAALGDEKAALAACDRMPEDTWSPGLWGGTPRGNKAEITEEIGRRARAAATTRC